MARQPAAASPVASRSTVRWLGVTGVRLKGRTMAARAIRWIQVLWLMAASHLPLALSWTY